MALRNEQMLKHCTFLFFFKTVTVQQHFTNQRLKHQIELPMLKILSSENAARNAIRLRVYTQLLLLPTSLGRYLSQHLELSIAWGSSTFYVPAPRAYLRVGLLLKIAAQTINS